MTTPKYSDLLIFELQIYEEGYLQKDSSSWVTRWTIILFFESTYPFPQACSAKVGLDIFAPQPLGGCTPTLFSWQISRSND